MRERNSQPAIGAASRKQQARLRRERRHRRLQVETLEARHLLASDTSPFVVNTPLDIVDSSDDLISLREAIASANVEPGVQEITFDLSTGATIQLTQGELIVSESVSLTGLGVGQSMINAGGLSRIFDVSASQTLTVEDLTLTGGSAEDGGAIRGGLNSQIVLQDARLADNSASRHGGAIYTIGAVEVLGSQLIDNAAISEGGAIHRAGTSGSRSVTIRESELIGNSSGQNGGAVFLRDSGLTIADSFFDSNSSQLAGGAISIGGGYTGLHISMSEFLSNSAKGFGGAIHMPAHADFTVRDSTFIGNSVTANGNGSAEGGAIYLTKTDFVVAAYVRTTIERSTFNENTANSGGAVQIGGGETVIRNSTISRNSAISGGAIGVRSTGITGGINIVAIDHTTITDNTATGPSGGAGVQAGNAITAHNSIIAGNHWTSGSTLSHDVNGGFIVGSSHNIIGLVNGSGVSNGVNGNLVGILDPGLAPLADNGGLTWTHAVLPNSPAISHANPATALLSDQRGVARQGGPEAGAYELESYVSPGGHTYANENVDGDLRLVSQGIVTLQIGGAKTTTDFDRLVVSGQAILDGTLHLDFTGYEPELESTWQLLQWGSRVGEFSNVVVTGLDPESLLTVKPIYESDGLSIVIETTAVGGDDLAFSIEQLNLGFADLDNLGGNLATLFGQPTLPVELLTEELDLLAQLQTAMTQVHTEFLQSVDQTYQDLDALKLALQHRGLTIETEGPFVDSFVHVKIDLATSGLVPDPQSLALSLADIGSLDKLGLSGSLGVTAQPTGQLTFGVDADGFYLLPETRLGVEVQGEATAQGDYGPLAIGVSGDFAIPLALSLTAVDANQDGKIRLGELNNNANFGASRFVRAEATADLVARLGIKRLDYIDVDADATNNTSRGGDIFQVGASTSAAVTISGDGYSVQWTPISTLEPELAPELQNFTFDRFVENLTELARETLSAGESLGDKIVEAANSLSMPFSTQSLSDFLALTDAINDWSPANLLAAGYGADTWLDSFGSFLNDSSNVPVMELVRVELDLGSIPLDDFITLPTFDLAEHFPEYVGEGSVRVDSLRLNGTLTLGLDTSNDPLYLIASTANPASVGVTGRFVATATDLELDELLRIQGTTTLTATPSVSASFAPTSGTEQRLGQPFEFVIEPEATLQIGVSAIAAELFPGRAGPITAGTDRVTGTFDMQTGATTLRADEVWVRIADSANLQARNVSFTFDPDDTDPSALVAELTNARIGFPQWDEFPVGALDKLSIRRDRIVVDNLDIQFPTTRATAQEITAIEASILASQSEAKAFAMAAATASFAATSFELSTLPNRFVMVVPDVLGSLPDADARDTWFVQLGTRPEDLLFEPLPGGQDLVTTLSNAGYTRFQLGQPIAAPNLFPATYDWRLSLVEHDGVDDGMIQFPDIDRDASAIEIGNRFVRNLRLGTSANFQTGMDYLGYWLGQASIAWKQQHGDVPFEIDLVGYGMGGLLARAYVQSEAYEQPFDFNGQTYQLPRVSNFVMVGTPNEGSATAASILQNDWSGDVIQESVLRGIANLAYQKVLGGDRLSLPDGTVIDRAAIAIPGSLAAVPTQVKVTGRRGDVIPVNLKQELLNELGISNATDFRIISSEFTSTDFVQLPNAPTSRDARFIAVKNEPLLAFGKIITSGGSANAKATATIPYGFHSFTFTAKENGVENNGLSIQFAVDTTRELDTTLDDKKLRIAYDAPNRKLTIHLNPNRHTSFDLIREFDVIQKRETETEQSELPFEVKASSLDIVSDAAFSATATSTPPQPSLSVVPFQNLQGKNSASLELDNHSLLISAKTSLEGTSSHTVQLLHSPARGLASAEFVAGKGLTIYVRAGETLADQVYEALLRNPSLVDRFDFLLKPLDSSTAKEPILSGSEGTSSFGTDGAFYFVPPNFYHHEALLEQKSLYEIVFTYTENEVSNPPSPEVKQAVVLINVLPGFQEKITLTSKVGDATEETSNAPLDVYRIEQRLRHLLYTAETPLASAYGNLSAVPGAPLYADGLSSTDLNEAIRLFQAATRSESESLKATDNPEVIAQPTISNGENSLTWLNAANAPMWLQLDVGALRELPNAYFQNKNRFWGSATNREAWASSWTLDLFNRNVADNYAMLTDRYPTGLAEYLDRGFNPIQVLAVSFDTETSAPTVHVRGTSHYRVGDPIQLRLPGLQTELTYIKTLIDSKRFTVESTPAIVAAAVTVKTQQPAYVEIKSGSEWIGPFGITNTEKKSENTQQRWRVAFETLPTGLKESAGGKAASSIRFVKNGEPIGGTEVVTKLEITKDGTGYFEFARTSANENAYGVSQEQTIAFRDATSFHNLATFATQGTRHQTHKSGNSIDWSIKQESMPTNELASDSGKGYFPDIALLAKLSAKSTIAELNQQLLHLNDSMKQQVLFTHTPKSSDTPSFIATLNTAMATRQAPKDLVKLLGDNKIALPKLKSGAAAIVSSEQESIWRIVDGEDEYTIKLEFNDATESFDFIFSDSGSGVLPSQVLLQTGNDTEVESYIESPSVGIEALNAGLVLDSIPSLLNDRLNELGIFLESPKMQKSWHFQGENQYYRNHDQKGVKQLMYYTVEFSDGKFEFRGDERQLNYWELDAIRSVVTIWLNAGDQVSQVLIGSSKQEHRRSRKVLNSLLSNVKIRSEIGHDNHIHVDLKPVKTAISLSKEVARAAIKVVGDRGEYLTIDLSKELRTSLKLGNDTELPFSEFSLLHGSFVGTDAVRLDATGGQAAANQFNQIGKFVVKVDPDAPAVIEGYVMATHTANGKAQRVSIPVQIQVRGSSLNSNEGTNPQDFISQYFASLVDLRGSDSPGLLFDLLHGVDGVSEAIGDRVRNLSLIEVHTPTNERQETLGIDEIDGISETADFLLLGDQGGSLQTGLYTRNTGILAETLIQLGFSSEDAVSISESAPKPPQVASVLKLLNDPVAGSVVDLRTNQRLGVDKVGDTVQVFTGLDDSYYLGGLDGLGFAWGANDGVYSTTHAKTSASTPIYAVSVYSGATIDSPITTRTFDEIGASDDRFFQIRQREILPTIDELIEFRGLSLSLNLNVAFTAGGFEFQSNAEGASQINVAADGLALFPDRSTEVLDGKLVAEGVIGSVDLATGELSLDLDKVTASVEGVFTATASGEDTNNDGEIDIPAVTLRYPPAESGDHERVIARLQNVQVTLDAFPDLPAGLLAVDEFIIRDDGFSLTRRDLQFAEDQTLTLGTTPVWLLIESPAIDEMLLDVRVSSEIFVSGGIEFSSGAAELLPGQTESSLLEIVDDDPEDDQPALQGFFDFATGAIDVEVRELVGSLGGIFSFSATSDDPNTPAVALRIDPTADSNAVALSIETLAATIPILDDSIGSPTVTIRDFSILQDTRFQIGSAEIEFPEGYTNRLGLGGIIPVELRRIGITIPDEGDYVFFGDAYFDRMELDVTAVVDLSEFNKQIRTTAGQTNFAATLSVDGVNVSDDGEVTFVVAVDSLRNGDFQIRELGEVELGIEGIEIGSYALSGSIQIGEIDALGILQPLAESGSQLKGVFEVTHKKSESQTVEASVTAYGTIRTDSDLTTVQLTGIAAFDDDNLRVGFTLGFTGGPTDAPPYFSVELQPPAITDVAIGEITFEIPNLIELTARDILLRTSPAANGELGVIGTIVAKPVPGSPLEGILVGETSLTVRDARLFEDGLRLNDVELLLSGLIKAGETNLLLVDDFRLALSQFVVGGDFSLSGEYGFSGSLDSITTSLAGIEFSADSIVVLPSASLVTGVADWEGVFAEIDVYFAESDEEEEEERSIDSAAFGFGVAVGLQGTYDTAAGTTTLTLGSLLAEPFAGFVLTASDITIALGNTPAALLSADLVSMSVPLGDDDDLVLEVEAFELSRGGAVSFHQASLTAPEAGLLSTLGVGGILPVDVTSVQVATFSQGAVVPDSRVVFQAGETPDFDVRVQGLIDVGLFNAIGLNAEVRIGNGIPANQFDATFRMVDGRIRPWNLGPLKVQLDNKDRDPIAGMEIDGTLVLGQYREGVLGSIFGVAGDDNVTATLGVKLINPGGGAAMESSITLAGSVFIGADEASLDLRGDLTVSAGVSGTFGGIEVSEGSIGFTMLLDASYGLGFTFTEFAIALGDVSIAEIVIDVNDVLTLTVSEVLVTNTQATGAERIGNIEQITVALAENSLLDDLLGDVEFVMTTNQASLYANRIEFDEVSFRIDGDIPAATFGLDGEDLLSFDDFEIRLTDFVVFGSFSPTNFGQSLSGVQAAGLNVFLGSGSLFPKADGAALATVQNLNVAFDLDPANTIPDGTLLIGIGEANARGVGGVFDFDLIPSSADQPAAKIVLGKSLDASIPWLDVMGTTSLGVTLSDNKTISISVDDLRIERNGAVSIASASLGTKSSAASGRPPGIGESLGLGGILPLDLTLIEIAALESGRISLDNFDSTVTVEGFFDFSLFEDFPVMPIVQMATIEQLNTNQTGDEFGAQQPFSFSLRVSDEGLRIEETGFITLGFQDLELGPLTANADITIGRFFDGEFEVAYPDRSNGSTNFNTVTPGIVTNLGFHWDGDEVNAGAAARLTGNIVKDASSGISRLTINGSVQASLFADEGQDPLFVEFENLAIQFGIDLRVDANLRYANASDQPPLTTKGVQFEEFSVSAGDFAYFSATNVVANLDLNTFKGATEPVSILTVGSGSIGFGARGNETNSSNPLAGLGGTVSNFALQWDADEPNVLQRLQLRLENDFGVEISLPTGAGFGLPDWLPIQIRKVGLRFPSLGDGLDVIDGQIGKAFVAGPDLLSDVELIFSGGINGGALDKLPIKGEVENARVNLATLKEYAQWLVDSTLAIASPAVKIVMDRKPRAADFASFDSIRALILDENYGPLAAIRELGPEMLSIFADRIEALRQLNPDLSTFPLNLDAFFLGVEELDLGTIKLGAGLGLGILKVDTDGDTVQDKDVFFVRVLGEFAYSDMGLGAEVIITDHGPLLGRLFAGVPIPIGTIIAGIAGSVFPGVGNGIGAAAGTASGFIITGFQGALVFGDGLQPIEKPIDILENPDLRFPFDLSLEGIRESIQKLYFTRDVNGNVVDLTDEQGNPLPIWGKGFTFAGSGTLTNIHVAGMIGASVTIGANVGYAEQVGIQMFGYGSLDIIGQSLVDVGIVFDFSDPLAPAFNIAAALPQKNSLLSLLLPVSADASLQLDSEGMVAGGIIATQTFLQSVINSAADEGARFFEGLLAELAADMQADLQGVRAGTKARPRLLTQFMIASNEAELATAIANTSVTITAESIKQKLIGPGGIFSFDLAQIDGSDALRGSNQTAISRFNIAATVAGELLREIMAFGPERLGSQLDEYLQGEPLLEAVLEKVDEAFQAGINAAATALTLDERNRVQSLIASSEEVLHTDTLAVQTLVKSYRNGVAAAKLQVAFAKVAADAISQAGEAAANAFFETINPSLTIEGNLQAQIFGMPIGDPAQSLEVRVNKEEIFFSGRTSILGSMIAGPLSGFLPITDTVELEVSLPFENLLRDLATFQPPVFDAERDWYGTFRGSVGGLGFTIADVNGYVFPSIYDGDTSNDFDENNDGIPDDHVLQGYITVVDAMPQVRDADGPAAVLSDRAEHLKHEGGFLFDGGINLPRFISDPLVWFTELGVDWNELITDENGNPRVDEEGKPICQSASTAFDCFLANPSVFIEFATGLAGRFYEEETLGQLQFFVPNIADDLLEILRAERPNATTDEMFETLRSEFNILVSRLEDVRRKFEDNFYLVGVYDGKLFGLDLGEAQIKSEDSQLIMTVNDVLGADAVFELDTRGSYPRFGGTLAVGSFAGPSASVLPTKQDVAAFFRDTLPGDFTSIAEWIDSDLLLPNTTASPSNQFGLRLSAFSPGYCDGESAEDACQETDAEFSTLLRNTGGLGVEVAVKTPTLLGELTGDLQFAAYANPNTPFSGAFHGKLGGTLEVSGKLTPAGLLSIRLEADNAEHAQLLSSLGFAFSASTTFELIVNFSDQAQTFVIDVVPPSRHPVIPASTIVAHAVGDLMINGVNIASGEFLLRAESGNRIGIEARGTVNLLGTQYTASGSFVAHKPQLAALLVASGFVELSLQNQVLPLLASWQLIEATARLDFAIGSSNAPLASFGINGKLDFGTLGQKLDVSGSIATNGAVSLNVGDLPELTFGVGASRFSLNLPGFSISANPAATNLSVSVTGASATVPGLGTFTVPPIAFQSTGSFSVNLAGDATFGILKVRGRLVLRSLGSGSGVELAILNNTSGAAPKIVVDSPISGQPSLLDVTMNPFVISSSGSLLAVGGGSASGTLNRLGQANVVEITDASVEIRMHVLQGLFIRMSGARLKMFGDSPHTIGIISFDSSGLAYAGSTIGASVARTFSLNSFTLTKALEKLGDLPGMAIDRLQSVQSTLGVELRLGNNGLEFSQQSNTTRTFNLFGVSISMSKFFVASSGVVEIDLTGPLNALGIFRIEGTQRMEFRRTSSGSASLTMLRNGTQPILVTLAGPGSTRLVEVRFNSNLRWSSNGNFTNTSGGAVSGSINAFGSDLLGMSGNVRIYRHATAGMSLEVTSARLRTGASNGVTVPDIRFSLAGVATLSLPSNFPLADRFKLPSNASALGVSLSMENGRLRLARINSFNVQVLPGANLSFSNLLMDSSGAFQATVTGSLKVLGHTLASGSFTASRNGNSGVVSLTVPSNAKRNLNLGFLSVAVSGYVASDGEFQLTGSKSVDFSVIGNGFNGQISINASSSGSFSGQFSGNATLLGESFGSASGNLSSGGCLTVTGSKNVSVRYFDINQGRFRTRTESITNTQRFSLASNACSGFSISASAINGYIVDATVFFDANGNGVADFLDLNSNGIQDEGEPSEPAAITRADGSVELSIPMEFDSDGDGRLTERDGQLVVVGGIDLSTGLPLDIALVAPVASEGSIVISPLSTFVNRLVNDYQLSPDAAIALVRDRFAVGDFDFLHSDAIDGWNQGDLRAGEAFAAQAKLNDTLHQMGWMVAGSPEGPRIETAVDAAVSTMTTLLATQTIVPDLSSAEFMKVWMQATADQLNWTASPDLISAAAMVTALGNEIIDQLPRDENFLANAKAIQDVAQGLVAPELASTSGGTMTPEQLLSKNTNMLFRQRVLSARVGSALPPKISVESSIAVLESSGQGEVQFMIELSEASTHPVRVSFASHDGTALAANMDYDPIEGILEFAPGETAKSITVALRGIAPGEFKTVQLRLSDPEMALLGQSMSVAGLIHDAGDFLTLDSLMFLGGTTGASVGNLTVLQPAELGAYTFTVSDDRFEVIDGRLQLKSDAVVNPALEATVPITVTANETTSGQQIRQTFALIVEDNITIHAHRFMVLEQTSGAIVGVLSDGIAGVDASQLTISDDRFEVAGTVLKLRDDQQLLVADERFVRVVVLRQFGDRLIQDIFTADVRNQEPLSSQRLSGGVFYDISGNGVRDPDEPYLNRRRLELNFENDSVAHQFTVLRDVDQNGNVAESEAGRFVFPDVPLGQLRLIVHGRRAVEKVMDVTLDAQKSDRNMDIPLVRPWTNPSLAEDVDSSGIVSALDALIIINRLNLTEGGGSLLDILPGALFEYYDVSGDGQATALDALEVISYLNRQSILNTAESELTEPPTTVEEIQSLTEFHFGDRPGSNVAKTVESIADSPQPLLVTKVSATALPDQPARRLTSVLADEYFANFGTAELEELSTPRPADWFAVNELLSTDIRADFDTTHDM